MPGIYSLRDIEVGDDGDIVLNEYGDAKIATPLRTVAQGINNTILTNKGELLGDPNYGANLQSFYGELNEFYTHRLIEANIKEALRLQGLVAMEDLEIDVVPVDLESAGLIVGLNNATFMDIVSTGRSELQPITEDRGLTMGYVYPFTSGIISPLTGVTE